MSSVYELVKTFLDAFIKSNYRYWRCINLFVCNNYDIEQDLIDSHKILLNSNHYFEPKGLYRKIIDAPISNYSLSSINNPNSAFYVIIFIIFIILIMLIMLLSN
jgi:hypothetical protein